MNSQEAPEQILYITGQIIQFNSESYRATLEDGRVYPLMLGDGPVAVKATEQGIAFKDIQPTPPLRTKTPVVLLYDDEGRFQCWTLISRVQRAQLRLTELKRIIAERSESQEARPDWSPCVGESDVMAAAA